MRIVTPLFQLTIGRLVYMAGMPFGFGFMWRPGSSQVDADGFPVPWSGLLPHKGRFSRIDFSWEVTFIPGYTDPRGCHLSTLLVIETGRNPRWEKKFGGRYTPAPPVPVAV